MAARRRLVPALVASRGSRWGLSAEATYAIRRWLRSSTVRATFGSLVLIVCVWSMLAWLSPERALERAEAWLEGMRQWGIAHSQVELGLGGAVGLQRVSRPQLEAALGLPRQGSMLDLSVPELQAAVEALPWVARAELRVGFPDRIHLRLQEEVPVALWWDGRRWLYVNDSGEGFATAEQGAPSQGLPRVVGEAAPVAVAEVRSMLDRFPRQFDRQSMFERVGARRWNVRLPSGILLMLPEREPLRAIAWLRGSGLLEQFSGQDVGSIDLRNRNRVPVRFRLPEHGLPGGTGVGQHGPL